MRKVMNLYRSERMFRGVWIFLSAVVALLYVAPSSAQDLKGEIENIVQDYIRRNPQEFQKLVREYLTSNPEVLQQVIADALKKQRGGAPQPVAAAPQAPGSDKAAAIKENAKAIFTSPHQVVLGNPDGDVTLVEFFDYSCGFCKRALADKLALIESDPKLRIVLKDLPILGPNSMDAARVAIAARVQDAGGQRYLDFHKKLLGDRLPPNKERALTFAREAGFNVDKFNDPAVSDEVDATIAETSALARALGINGTPSYVVGDRVVIGAVGAATLKESVRLARSGQR